MNWISYKYTHDEAENLCMTKLSPSGSLWVVIDYSWYRHKYMNMNIWTALLHEFYGPGPDCKLLGDSAYVRYVSRFYGVTREWICIIHAQYHLTVYHDKYWSYIWTTVWAVLFSIALQIMYLTQHNRHIVNLFMFICLHLWVSR